MGRKANPELKASWQGRIERQLSSGLTIAEFCLREQCSVNSFHAWKRRLGQIQAGDQQPDVGEFVRRGGKAARRTAGRPVDRQPGSGAFIQLPVLAQPMHSAAQFVLVDGTIVRVPADNFAALRLVLEMIRGDDQGRIARGGRHV
jgi:hypothetical protein